MGRIGTGWSRGVGRSHERRHTHLFDSSWVASKRASMWTSLSPGYVASVSQSWLATCLKSFYPTGVQVDCDPHIKQIWLPPDYTSWFLQHEVMRKIRVLVRHSQELLRSDPSAGWCASFPIKLGFSCLFFGSRGFWVIGNNPGSPLASLCSITAPIRSFDAFVAFHMAWWGPQQPCLPLQ